MIFWCTGSKMVRDLTDSGFDSNLNKPSPFLPVPLPTSPNGTIKTECHFVEARSKHEPHL
jgi:hypothetical protein